MAQETPSESEKDEFYNGIVLVMKLEDRYARKPAKIVRIGYDG
ncbi:MAG TPA: hypothetical protein VG815_07985 [Chloroflexota bacterium]|nr:hypothetical protein [Chloroflexota bacterium]